ncbi:MAG: septal ring lytic transglycosylase RlpA family protein [Flavobacteriia bacterium]
MRSFFSIITLILLLSFQQSALEKGTASYYSSSMNGRKTSSGEVFQNSGFTAAHKSLPLGSYVRVTNLKNDSIVELKVNDRLSKSSSHVIDVTLAAAKKLNFVRNGITTVTVEPMSKRDEETKQR